MLVRRLKRRKNSFFGVFNMYPERILRRSVEVLQMFLGMLRKLRNIADTYSNSLASEGFTRFFGMLKEELSDGYFVSVQRHLKELKFRYGILMSAQLGEGNKGGNYLLRKQPVREQSWIEWLWAHVLSNWVFRYPGYTYYLHPRDESGARALAELRQRGLNPVANALAQSVDHILNFFKMLRTEMAFYTGCVNLHEQLARKGEPVCFPVPAGPDERRRSAKGLYDVCLALHLGQRVVGNELHADKKNVVVITGANQGGKSTFLRGVGLAQLMMQCGMFVPAEFFCASVCYGISTHFKREEDATMTKGKLEEELSRTSDIVDHVTSHSLILFNEAFAATNEREGAQIAGQIVRALSEKQVAVFFVTHLYEFSRSLYDSRLESAVFLRAERKTDGGRSFKIREGEPLQTSFGRDLYEKIFGAESEDHVTAWPVGRQPSMVE